MVVGTFIPSGLNEMEMEIIIEKFNILLNKADIHISFYRTSDTKLLKYFLNLDEKLLEKLTIHIISSSNLLDSEIEKTIYLLTTKGLTLKEHLLPINKNGETSEEYYTLFTQNLLKECDEVISFKSSDHKQFTKVLRPLDLAKERGRKVYVVELERDGKIIKE